MNKELVKAFENKTGLKLKDNYNDGYYEISGKSYGEIMQKCLEWNAANPNNGVACIDDSVKDITIIKFLG